MSANHLTVELVPGKLAPKYQAPEFTAELTIEKAVITEQGMESGLPLVDLVMVGPDGSRYFGVLTGRIINVLSAAIKGVNMRNHGVEEP